MNSLAPCCVHFRSLLAGFTAGLLLLLMGGGTQSYAQLSRVQNPATPADPVIFTFVNPMDTQASQAYFFINNLVMLSTQSPTWNNQMYIMTIYPVGQWPSGTNINWYLNCEDLFGDPVGDNGSFRVGGGSDPEYGGGTNVTTSFSVQKFHLYEQTNSAGAYAIEGLPFWFGSTVMLATNRTASEVTMATPFGPMSSVKTLGYLGGQGLFSFNEFAPLADFLELSYPSGTYQFDVKSAASNQTVGVSFTLAQPSAPVVKDFAALASVNPSQPLVLSWNAFAGGTASDYIHVSIGEKFASADYGVAGALNGTATSVTIPAGTLDGGTTYTANLSFHRYAVTTNTAQNYVTMASRVSTTEFDLTTVTASVQPTPVQNVRVVDGRLTFQVTAPAGTVLYMDYASNPAGPWTELYTTNAPGGLMEMADPNPMTAAARYYRLRY